MRTRDAWLLALPLAALLCACGGGARDLTKGEGEVDASRTVQSSPVPVPPSGGKRLALPPAGRLYHGVFPAGFTRPEPDSNISRVNLDEYEQAVGRRAAWVYLDNNWYQQRAFPTRTATWIRERGSLPFIRLMLRSATVEGQAEPVYSLERILRGDFDADLQRWADAARDFESPLVVEFGTEVNGDWFQWTPTWNGGGLEQGAERFKAAYRHIVHTMRERGASNILWAFHVNAGTFPNDPRNSMKALYPGDDVVDWVGLSVYGAHTPFVGRCDRFSDKMDRALPELQAAAPGKPLFVFEFGVTDNSPHCRPGEWVDEALGDMLGGRWPQLKGFSWWNERWKNSANPKEDSNMVVQQVEALAQAFQAHFRGPWAHAVVEEPLFEQR